MPIPPAVSFFGRPSASIDMNSLIRQVSDGSVVELGESGSAELTYSVDGRYVDGMININMQADATFPNIGSPMYIAGADLPYIPRSSYPINMSDAPQSGGAGFINVIESSAYAISSVTTNIGSLDVPGIFFLITTEPGDGGYGNFMSDTTPVALTGMSVFISCRIRYEIA